MGSLVQLHGEARGRGRQGYLTRGIMTSWELPKMAVSDVDSPVGGKPVNVPDFVMKIVHILGKL